MAGRIARCSRPRPVYSSGSSGWQPAIRATSSRWAKASRRCGSDHGPGYRVYFKRQGHTIVVLLAGGNKRTQESDIETALRLAKKNL